MSDFPKINAVGHSFGTWEYILASSIEKDKQRKRPNGHIHAKKYFLQRPRVKKSPDIRSVYGHLLSGWQH